MVIETGIECSPEFIRAQNPDVAVIASGPVMKGLSAGILRPRDVMLENVEVGRRVAIIGAGGVGLGVAVYLLRKGEFEITIIDEALKPGRDVNPFYLWQYMALMKKKKVMFLMKTSVKSIGKDTITFAGPSGTGVFEADAIVMSVFYPEDETWKRSEESLAKEVYFIGDAKKPRRLLNAIHDGYRLGMVI